MAKRRPSYISIRARQRNILEAFGTSGATNYATAAKSLGVPESEFRRFITMKPEQVRRQYSRRPAFRELYGEQMTAPQQRAAVARKVGVKRVTRYPYEENVLRVPALLPGRTPEAKARAKTIGRFKQHLYYDNNVKPQDWTQYTFEQDIPSSPRKIVQLYRDGKINKGRMRRIINKFREDYPNAKIGAIFGMEFEQDDYEDYFEGEE